MQHSPVMGMMNPSSNSGNFVSPAPKTDSQSELASPQRRPKAFSSNNDADSDSKMPVPEVPLIKSGRDTEPGIPYEWVSVAKDSIRMQVIE